MAVAQEEMVRFAAAQEGALAFFVAFLRAIVGKEALQEGVLRGPWHQSLLFQQPQQAPRLVCAGQRADQGLMGGLVHGGHRVIRGRLQVVKCQLDVLLLVSFQLLNEGPLMEEPLQPVLGIVVAQLLKGGPTGRPTLLRVLEAWGVHDHHRAERVLAGLEGPVHQGDEKREELTVEAGCHALQAFQRTQFGACAVAQAALLRALAEGRGALQGASLVVVLEDG